MIFDYLLIILSLIFVIPALIVDLKIREVPDWISYSLVVSALGIRGIESIYTSNYLFLFYGLLGAITGFLIGGLFYLTKQWGGGDAKLLMGLGAVFGSKLNIPFFNPIFDYPILLILIINILIAGAIYSLVWAFVLMAKYRKKVFSDLDIVIKIKSIICFIILLILNFILYLIPGYNLYLSLIFSLIFIFISIIFIFSKRIEVNSMHKKINVKNLREGDWPVNNILAGGKVIYRAPGFGLSLETINKIKKSNLKSILIKEGIPFVPAFFIGLILTLICGNLFYLII